MAKPQPNFMLRTRSGNRWLAAGVTALVLGVAVWIGIDYANNRIQSREFDGLVERVDGNLLTVKGFYMVDGHPVSRSGKGDDVTVRITPDTKFSLTTLKLPEFGPNSTGSRSYDPNALLQTTVSGSLRDMKANLALNVSTAGNIFQKSQFDAAAVSYQDFSFVKKTDPPLPSP